MELLPLLCLCLLTRSGITSAQLNRAAPEPSVKILNLTNNSVLLQCEVQDASPDLKVELQDSAGNTLPAEEPQVSERGDRYYITLQTTVFKTDNFSCVVTQEETNQQIYAQTFVHISASAADSSDEDSEGQMSLRKGLGGSFLGRLGFRNRWIGGILVIGFIGATLAMIANKLYLVLKQLKVRLNHVLYQHIHNAKTFRLIIYMNLMFTVF
ncbi:uncharacterized protein LOC118495230 isoform X2 [Sander lucioperca]|uniref:uncharacterized protein LOC118495230 isoform X2 n=1 Tax=Sander lucioperca TaxID=283035 RepID=UPI00165362E3|nr:uncharacterized protein LOC118495230 isoform X2 [Sander lucioperca]